MPYDIFTRGVVLRRIVIYGRPGSGKSTLANTLGPLLNLPVYHLDHYFYLPGWQERPQEDFCALQVQLVSQEQWIIEGNNSRSFNIRFPRADLVISLSLPRWLCFYRVFKRYLKRHELCGSLPADCPNRMSWWLLVYMWRYDARVQGVVQLLRGQFPHIPFISLTSQREVDELVAAAQAYMATRNR